MIEALTAFHFLRPWALLFLLPAIALWWVERRRRDTALRWRRAIDPELLRHLLVRPGGGSGVIPADVLLIAWAIGAAALAGPSWRQEPSPFADAQPPAMIVLRVTPSMTTADVPPTRLERAQQKIADLVGLREGAATGLVAYSGSAHLVLPPTTDGSVVADMAKALVPEVMPREGDSLADAVALAAQVLAEGGRGGAILVLADTVSPDQVSALQGHARSAAQVLLLPVAPPASVAADRALSDAAEALGATTIDLSIDTADIQAVARRMARATPSGTIAGDGQRWEEAGYWLVPLLALFVLFWFRRGWVLAE
jgi:Ca-activated chloride channel family protein